MFFLTRSPKVQRKKKPPNNKSKDRPCSPSSVGFLLSLCGRNEAKQQTGKWVLSEKKKKEHEGKDLLESDSRWKIKIKNFFSFFFWETSFLQFGHEVNLFPFYTFSLLFCQKSKSRPSSFFLFHFVPQIFFLISFDHFHFIIIFVFILILIHYF